MWMGVVEVTSWQNVLCSKELCEHFKDISASLPSLSLSLSLSLCLSVSPSLSLSLSLSPLSSLSLSPACIGLSEGPSSSVGQPQVSSTANSAAGKSLYEYILHFGKQQVTSVVGRPITALHNLFFELLVNTAFSLPCRRLIAKVKWKQDESNYSMSYNHNGITPEIICII